MDSGVAVVVGSIYSDAHEFFQARPKCDTSAICPPSLCKLSQPRTLHQPDSETDTPHALSLLHSIYIHATLMRVSRKFPYPPPPLYMLYNVHVGGYVDSPPPSFYNVTSV